MATNIKIPKGKKVNIEVDGVTVPESIPLTLEENVTLSASSSFDTLLGGGGKISKALTFFGKVYSDIGGTGFGGQLKQMGMQTWTSTDPLTLSSLTFTFYLGINDQWDGFAEVKKPILQLMKLTLPEEGKGGSLVAPGPSPLSLFEGTFLEPGVKKVASKLRSISIDLGGIIYLPDVIIKKAEPTFSVEVDDKGMPVWGQISIDVQSLFTATGNLIDEELDRGANAGSSYYRTL